MYPTAPGERVHADFAEFEGQHYLIMIDAYSKWLEVYEMGTSTTGSKTIEVMRRVFSFHGIPRRKEMVSNTNSHLRITHRVMDKQKEQFKSSRDL